MKYIIAILFVSLSFGCAPDSGSKGLSSPFQPYLDNFAAQSRKVGRPVNMGGLKVKMDPTMAGPSPTNGYYIIGMCRISGNNAEITINPIFWNDSSYSAADREELMFHELGHCVLKRGHRTERNGSSILSIMYPSHLGHRTYVTNYEYYMNELFGKNPAPVLYATGTHGTNVFDENIYASMASLSDMTETRTYGTSLKVGEELELGCGEE